MLLFSWKNCSSFSALLNTYTIFIPNGNKTSDWIYFPYAPDVLTAV